MIHEELTRSILGVCFEVSNELGAGFLESVYQKALVLGLKQGGMRAQEQVKLEVAFRCENVGIFYADIVVEDKVLLEIKAVRALAPEHQAQVINYLKATKLEVGLLLNFGRYPVHPVNLVNEFSCNRMNQIIRMESCYPSRASFILANTSRFLPI